MVIGLQVVLVASGASPLLDGRLMDGDCYMRLMRVVDLHDGGGWFDQVQRRTNAPYGETPQWSRLLDLILWGPAALAATLGEFRPALVAWGAALGPALALTVLPALFAGARPLLSARATLWAVLALLIQPQLSATLMVGRPDHHGLMAVLFLAGLMACQRLAARPRRLGLAAAAGLAGGLGLWVSVESQAALAALVGGLALWWVARGGAVVRGLAVYAAAAAGVTAVAVAAERGPNWAAPLADRVSVMHAALALAAALGWLAAAALAPCWGGTVRRRAALVAAAVALPLATAAWAFPRFFRGPWDGYDPAAVAWLDTIAEFQPLFPTDSTRAAQFCLQLGPPLLAAAYAAWRLRHRPAAAAPAMALSLAGLAVFVPLSLYQVRWASYAQILALLPWAHLLASLWRWDGTAPLGTRRLALRTPALAAALAAPLAAALVLAPPASPPAACDWAAMGRHLSRHARPADIVATYVFAGPELAWHSGLRVVGAPYTTAAALADTTRLLAATDESTALEVVRRRGVAWVLLCPDSPESADWRDPGRLSLLSRMESGHPPPWLTPTPLPPELAGFRLAKVRD